MSWTKITEEMPPAGKVVLLKQQREGYQPFVIVGNYIAKHTVESDEDWAEYSEEHDEYYCPEGFYERQMNWDDYAWIAVDKDIPVIEWMEIPGGEA